MSKYVLAIDQGTTGTTVLLIGKDLQVYGRGYKEIRQIYPQPGWVEHNPSDIWASVGQAVQKALADAKAKGKDIAAIGITNQRETCLFWDRKDGRTPHNAIVWQCRRTSERCERLKSLGKEPLIQQRTGLVIDPYFSATKIQWLIENVKVVRNKIADGQWLAGTIDSFLLWKLSGGKVHATDPSNASRTSLMNLRTLRWEPELLGLFNIPSHILPDIRPTSDVYGTTKGLSYLPDGIPIGALVGDQQAALFGQMCVNQGEAKCTYGTGAFLLMNTGLQPVISRHRLLSSVAWQRGMDVSYALEGSVFVSGAAVQWLRDGLGFIKKSEEITPLAQSVKDSGGVVFIPAFVGLGAPYWKSSARGALVGLTRGTTRGHIARATLEAMAFQVCDIMKTTEEDSGVRVTSLKVDGGAARNDLLLQFQADLLEVEVIRPKVIETTALGAALLAGLAVNFWKSIGAVKDAWKEERRFRPKMKPEERVVHLKRWRDAIAKI
ncbi:MAG: glycerol kinase GlpK [Nitrospirae bacterium]|nr:glycerol kinase GlpK [Nitrospirota bacterium]